MLSERSPQFGSREPLPSKENRPLHTLPVLLPIGGLGTRAREVTGDIIPKHLIRLDENSTILDVVCQQLQEIDFRYFIFCVAHHAHQLVEHLSQQSWITDPNTAYEFSYDAFPLGPDGAIYHTIRQRNLNNPVTVIPGDMFLPWKSIPNMVDNHLQRQADITIGVTSVVTERTTDVGKILVNSTSGRLVRCLRRDESQPNLPPDIQAVTSAGMFMIHPDRYQEIYNSYIQENNLNTQQLVSMRDDLLPWIINRNNYQVNAFDLQGEVLDLGVKPNIEYGQQHWKDYR